MTDARCELAFGRTVIAGAVAALLQLGAAAAQPADTMAQPADTTAGRDKQVIERIIACLASGQEAVLLQRSVECKAYRTGGGALSVSMPLQTDVTAACAEARDKPWDWRRLSTSAIKRIVESRQPAIDRMGIRVLGAIFCERLNLIGLDLSHSLVLDRSVFREGIEVRNFRTSGDLSLDGVLLLGELSIARSHVGGTIFASGAYFGRVRIVDSEIHGSVLFRKTVLSEPAVFDTVSVSGELSVQYSALSYFFLQFSKVGGVLDLTGSQARCAYHVRKSEIGDVVAVDAGFGAGLRDAARQSLLDQRLLDQRLPDPSDAVKIAMTHPGPSMTVGAGSCDYWTIAQAGAFVVSDSRVRSSLCLRSFHWEAPATADGRGFVTLGDLTVGTAAYIDLGPVAGQQPGARAAQKRKFEAVGIRTGSLIFNFRIVGEIDQLSVNGLGFDRVYVAEAEAACGYDPDFIKPPATVVRRLDTISDPHSQLRAPVVDEIMGWLDRNCLDSTQPLSAFVDAAQKSGNDDAAKELRIRRATKELTLRAKRIIGADRKADCDPAPKPAAPAEQSVLSSGILGFINLLSDAVAILFGGMLWIVADHGYRPERVGWIVLLVLAGSAAYFWRWVRVVGFKPKNKDTIRPIGLTFLFDRLLPAYQIRAENHDIDKFFRRARTVGRGKVLAPEDAHATMMQGRWRRIPVVEANAKDVERVERFLDRIKAVGLVLAIFLVAAINALVRQ